jgi:hypothetical protein
MGRRLFLDDCSGPISTRFLALDNVFQGVVLRSALAWRNADAKRPGMHSHAKRRNEIANKQPNKKPSPVFLKKHLPNGELL